MTTINIQTANFTGNSSVVREETVDFSQIEKELQEIKELLKKGSPEYSAVETLEKKSRERNWETLSKTALGFTSQFASGALANLTGAYLGKLLGL